MKRAIIATATLLAVAATARADHEQQGADIVRTRCGNCHVVGHGKKLTKQPHGFVDLTMTTQNRKDDWLRAWLTNPNAVKPDTRCFIAGLDARQIDVLVAFLHKRSEAPRAVVVPPPKYDSGEQVEAPPPPSNKFVRGR